MKARGKVDNYSVSVAEPAAARPGVETYMERFHTECEAADADYAAAEAAVSSASATGVAGATRTAAPPAGASSAMDIDEDDSYVLPPEHTGWDPLDLAPRAGETAYQVAVRMQLKGRKHTSYVTKWGDPNSLTAVMNRSASTSIAP